MKDSSAAAELAARAARLLLDEVHAQPMPGRLETGVVSHAGLHCTADDGTDRLTGELGEIGQVGPRRSLPHSSIGL